MIDEARIEPGSGRAESETGGRRPVADLAELVLCGDRIGVGTLLSVARPAVLAPRRDHILFVTPEQGAWDPATITELASLAADRRIVISFRGQPIDPVAVDLARRHGIGFSLDIDDTGRPEIELLQRHRPQVVSFPVHGPLLSAGSERVVAELVGVIAARIGAHVLATGVEHRHDLSVLAELGVRLACGPAVTESTIAAAPPPHVWTRAAA